MKEEKKFQAESKELLSLMINSIYSNKEVFLRELVSNASDAIDKYKILALQSSGKYPLKDYKIKIITDEKEKYLEIIDNGIGMSKESLEENLGTIAKSGTKEFLTKLKEEKSKKKDVDLIGQFGVGFYSAFMVAKKIEVYSKDIDGNCHEFSSDGVDTYTIESLDNIDALKDSGTIIRIYLKDDGDENYSTYLSFYTIQNLVKKYSDFIRYPIKMNEVKNVNDKDENGKDIEGKTHEEIIEHTLNSMIPIWKKKKKDVSEENLAEFYKTRFDDFEAPLLSINIKAEGTLEYNSLVFIPGHAPYNLYSQDYEKGLALYAKGIFISEKNKDLIPDYLKFVKGLVDSEDLSLNISREMLQKSPVLTKISKNIENKIIERLKELMKDDYDKYLKFFNIYGFSLKYGVYSSFGSKNDLLKELLVFKSLNNEKEISFKTYKDNMKEGQKYIYYAAGKTLESLKLLPELEKYRKENIDVLFLTDSVDEFALSILHEFDKCEFKNISNEDKDELSDEDKKKIADLETENRRILDDIKKALTGKVDDVTFNLHLGKAPVSLMSKDGLSMNMEHVLNNENASRPDPENRFNASKVLTINPTHPLFEAIKNITDEKEVDTFSSLLYEEAKLLEGYEIEDKEKFINSLNLLLQKAYK